MKIYWFGLLLVLVGCSSPKTGNNPVKEEKTVAASVPADNLTKIHFTELEHDFGILELKKPVDFIFEFSNAGEKPLTIRDVSTSCGCTVADWPKEPVKHGEGGSIKVGYDAKSPGNFSKIIRVQYNGPDSPVILRIKGTVGEPEEPGRAH